MNEHEVQNWSQNYDWKKRVLHKLNLLIALVGVLILAVMLDMWLGNDKEREFQDSVIGSLHSIYDALDERDKADQERDKADLAESKARVAGHEATSSRFKALNAHLDVLEEICRGANPSPAPDN